MVLRTLGEQLLGEFRLIPDTLELVLQHFNPLGLIVQTVIRQRRRRKGLLSSTEKEPHRPDSDDADEHDGEHHQHRDCHVSEPISVVPSRRSVQAFRLLIVKSYSEVAWAGVRRGNRC